MTPKTRSSLELSSTENVGRCAVVGNSLVVMGISLTWSMPVVLMISSANPHHVVEGVFKGTARALRCALERDPRVQGLPTVKGAL